MSTKIKRKDFKSIKVYKLLIVYNENTSLSFNTKCFFEPNFKSR